MSIPTTFKAAVVPEPHAQHTIADRSLPPLDPNQVAIKITATAVNPVDWKIRDYNVFLKEYPAVLGSDAAGEIVATGSNVTSHAVGDRVFFQGIIGNYPASTFQQYCIMPAELVSKTPANISDDQAAGISLASIAVVTGFYDQTGHAIAPTPWAEGGSEAGKGKAIAIIGGASSVGQYAIQFARLSGFERIITNASAAHHGFLKSLGAHVVLDRKSATAEDFVAAAGELPVSYVYDAISVKETQKLGVEIGQVSRVATRVVTVQLVDTDAVQLGQTQEHKVEVKQILGLGSSSALRHLSEPFAKAIGGEEGWIAKGLFVPNRVRLIAGGLGAVEEALKTNKDGVSGEKVVFRPNDA
ncbi:zinc-binding alcohol dehydrogenase family protein [Aspergillus ibericus CBS 121593]|uniref:GroES-like protein n=1 Tax=Aspergillus ibericus CBS 121593 TaxID=1448316 RepID=A0A395H4Z1_9EURO|nr:GroES-like protein [Aspergillus ibericus CBS 121593]RAL02633.1 GroES-like protein [Aspergillus ibericus CBS 121593]